MRNFFGGIICGFFITTTVLAVSSPIDDSVTSSAETSNLNQNDINGRLTVVEEKIGNIQIQINQLDERLNSIGQNKEQLKEPNLIDKENFSEKFSIIFKSMQQYLEKLAARLDIDSQLFILLIIGMIVLSLIYLLFRRRSIKDKISGSHTKDEYNIMENPEGIAAKLNLARAYISMGKTIEAQTMLQEVLAIGSTSEQMEARELLNKIKKI